MLRAPNVGERRLQPLEVRADDAELVAVGRRPGDRVVERRRPRVGGPPLRLRLEVAQLALERQLRVGELGGGARVLRLVVVELALQLALLRRQLRRERLRVVLELGGLQEVLVPAEQRLGCRSSVGRPGGGADGGERA